MRIDEYDFGRIVVNGKEYRRDLIILPDKVIPNWWRREGHSLCVDDLKAIINEPIEVLVIGTGYYGVMRVPNEVIEELKRRGIREIIVKPTREACNIFNELIKKGVRVCAALHLTC